MATRCWKMSASMMSSQKIALNRLPPSDEYLTNVDLLFPTHASYDIFQFLRVLRRELAEVEKNKDAFLSDFTQVTKLKHGETLAN
jgi:hypothetical protein